MIRWVKSLFRPAPEPVRPVPELDRSSTVDDRFRSERWVIEQAFEQIMADVDAPSDAKHRLLSLYAEAHRSGDPRREAEAVEAAFQGIEWGREYFGSWTERFRTNGEFPYMWKSYLELRSDPLPPRTIDEALEYLRVPDMRRLALDLGVMPDKSRPKKRTEFIDLLSRTGESAPVLNAAMACFSERLQERHRRLERAKCKLLAHTLTARVYSLIRMASWSRIRNQAGWRMRATSTSCPVESEYVAKFNTGKLDILPPYFPGDRTSIIIERGGSEQ